MPRTTEVITFSLPPEMAEQVRQLMKDEDRTMSGLIRAALRLYMDEREWLQSERRERARSRQTEQEEARKGPHS